MGQVSSADLSPGTVVLGKYRIDGVLGRGGMGVVYAAYHTFMDQRVALKLLLPETFHNEEAVGRFITEARHAAKIPGDNVCRILDVGLLDSGLPYMAMECLTGRSLDAIVTEGHVVSPGEAARWILEALVAVAHAHARGIVHRDLKPSNLFLATGEDGSATVKVLDFGISKSAESANHNVTSTRGLVGSPAYLAPEQVRNSRALDTRADLWALGVVLYELVSGAIPFDAPSLGELFVAILESEPVPLLSRRPDVPPEFAAVVHRCLAKRTDARFQNAAELATALAPFASPEGPVLVDAIAKALGSKINSHTSLPGLDGIPPVLGASSSGQFSAPELATHGTTRTTGPSWTTQSQAARGRVKPLTWLAAGGVTVGVLALATVVAVTFHGKAMSAAKGSAAVTPPAPNPAQVRPPDNAPAVSSQLSAVAAEPPGGNTAIAPSASTTTLASSSAAPRRSVAPFAVPKVRHGKSASDLSTSRD